MNKTLKHYFNEVFEAFIAIIIITLVTRHKFDFYEVFKLALIVGTITFCLEFYDSSFKQDIKRGMIFTVGGKLVG